MIFFRRVIIAVVISLVLSSQAGAPGKTDTPVKSFSDRVSNLFTTAIAKN